MSEEPSAGEPVREVSARTGSATRLIVVVALAALLLAASFVLASSRSDDRAAVVRVEQAADQQEARDRDEDPSPSDGDASATPAGDAGPGATSPDPGEPASVTLAFSGDLLPHDAVNDQAAEYALGSTKAHDFAPMFAPLAPVIGAADVAVCHLEVPVAPPGEEVSTYPSFGAPAELVDGARSAGFDGCSTASNHSLDRGQAGIAATLDRLDLNDLRHAGTARTAEEADTVTTYETAGATIAHLSYAYGFNGYETPADAPWSVQAIDPARIRADAERARAEGADLVVVSLHWGTEYDSEPSAYQRDVAGQILPSPDIDLVIGHHAHVVQPIEQVAGTYVVWGLGNQLSNMTQAERRDGLTVVAAAARSGDRWAFTGIDAVPTYVDLDTFEVLPVTAALADPATPEGLRLELSDSYDRTLAILLQGRAPGVTVDPKL